MFLHTLRSFWRAFAHYWQASSRAQQAMFITGTMLFASMIFHGIMLVVTGSSISGPVSFRKAMTFAETLGLACWSVGWMLPMFKLRRLTEWLISSFVMLVAIGEAFLMSMQVWRGVPSHYNFTTPFNAAVFYATGAGAAGFSVVAIILLRLSFRKTNATPSILLAVRAGLLMTLCGSVVGVLMSINNGPIWQGIAAIVARYGHGVIGRYAGQAEGTIGGSLITIHALGVHGLELLPLVGWMLGYSTLAERARTRLVAATALSWATLLALLAFQALRGQPLFAADSVTGLLLLLAALAITACMLIATTHAVRGILRSEGFTKHRLNASPA